MLEMEAFEILWQQILADNVPCYYGPLVSFDFRSNCGFIRSHELGRVLIHISALRLADINNIRLGDIYCFEALRRTKGWQAYRVLSVHQVCCTSSSRGFDPRGGVINSACAISTELDRTRLFPQSVCMTVNESKPVVYHSTDNVLIDLAYPTETNNQALSRSMRTVKNSLF